MSGREERYRKAGDNLLIEINKQNPFLDDETRKKVPALTIILYKVQETLVSITEPILKRKVPILLRCMPRFHINNHSAS